MNIILATQNKGKVEEFNRIFADYSVELSSIVDYGITLEPEETGNTFSENAQIKLEYYLEAIQNNKAYDSSQKNLLLAEDSGIEIKALNGEPGVLWLSFGDRRHHRCDISFPPRLLPLDFLKCSENDRGVMRACDANCTM